MAAFNHIIFNSKQESRNKILQEMEGIGLDYSKVANNFAIEATQFTSVLDSLGEFIEEKDNYDLVVIDSLASVRPNIVTVTQLFS